MRKRKERREAEPSLLSSLMRTGLGNLIFSLTAGKVDMRE